MIQVLAHSMELSTHLESWKSSHEVKIELYQYSSNFPVACKFDWSKESTIHFFYNIMYDTK